MIKYSEDANLYVETRSPMEKCSPPAPVKVTAYRQIAMKLADGVTPEITERMLNDNYHEALRLLEEDVCQVYRLLSGKGGVTQEEWDFIVDNVKKGNYVFQNIVLQLGTPMNPVIGATGTPAQKRETTEKFLKQILSKHGISLQIVPPIPGDYLYEKTEDYLRSLAAALKIHMEFKSIETHLESCDYVKTKKRLHYITIYDFLKYHLGCNKIPNKQELIQLLQGCKDHDVLGIRLSVDEIQKIPGDFFAEYERYRDFKMIQVMGRWFGKSTVRCISSAAYRYFADQIDENLLNDALHYMKVHTATLVPKKSVSRFEGTSAIFRYSVEGFTGRQLWATLDTNGYAKDYRQTAKLIKDVGIQGFRADNLQMGKTYYASLWEMNDDDDVVKLGDLPAVTPGINWPDVKSVQKMQSDRSLRLTVEFANRSQIAQFQYIACVKAGTARIQSPKDGMRLMGTVSGNSISFQARNLQYDQPYQICVFAVDRSGKYGKRIVPDFSYTPVEKEMLRVIRKEGRRVDEVNLDFDGNQWPSSELPDGTIIQFACRTDRFPKDMNDSEPGYEIAPLGKVSYSGGAFKVKIRKNGGSSAVLFLCGWIKSGNAAGTLVVRNALYEINYHRQKEGVFGHKYSVTFHVASHIPRIPRLSFVAYNRGGNMVASGTFDSQKIDSKGTPVQDVRYEFTATGKVAGFVIRPENLAERRLFYFREV